MLREGCCGKIHKESSPHAIHFVLAAEDPMRLPWMIEAGMGAAFRYCTFPDHIAPYSARQGQPP